MNSYNKNDLDLRTPFYIPYKKIDVYHLKDFKESGVKCRMYFETIEFNSDEEYDRWINQFKQQ